ncbi:MAG: BON domain-containing protein, partial [Acidobacteriota bacterium]
MELIPQPRVNGKFGSNRREVLVPASVNVFYRSLLRTMLLCLGCAVLHSTAGAQATGAEGTQPGPAPGKEELSPSLAKVDVKPVARDEEIRRRLESVLVATEWFTAPKVRVEEGVVFLEGHAASGDLKKWAGDLARHTQDVVAVVNRMTVPEPSLWDLTPARNGLIALWREFIRSLPLLLVGLLILALSVGAAALTASGTRAFLRGKIRTSLLRNVVALAAGGLVLLFGS